MHYARWQKHGDPLWEPRIPAVGCIVEDCTNTHAAFGYCRSHYYRLGRYGNASIPLKMPQVSRKKPGDPEGWLNDQGYRLLSRAGHPNSNKQGIIREHIYVMSKHLNRPLLKNENVHHKNGQRADNRVENLELWSKGQPPGQRISDKLRWALELIETYGNDPSVYEEYLEEFDG